MHAAVQGSDTDILWVFFTEEEAALALVFFLHKTRSRMIEVFSGETRRRDSGRCPSKMRLNPPQHSELQRCSSCRATSNGLFLFLARPVLFTLTVKPVRPQVGFSLPACHDYDSLESTRSLLLSPQEGNRFPSSFQCAHTSLMLLPSPWHILPMLALAANQRRTNVFQMGLCGADVCLVNKVTFQQILHELVADQVATKKDDFCRDFKT